MYTNGNEGHSVITTLLPIEHMVTYINNARSYLYECVAESQSQGGLGALAYASPSDFLHFAEARGLRLDSQRRPSTKKSAEDIVRPPERME